MYDAIVIYIIIALVSITVGWLIANYQYSQQKIKQLIEREEIMSSLSAAKQQIILSNHWRDKCEILNNELCNLRNINTSLEINLRETTIKLDSKKFNEADKISQLLDNDQRLNERFENLASYIFEHGSNLVNEQDRQSLNNLLIPLREQLESFRRQMQENFGQEARERHILTHEIRNLQQLNAQISQEAINLTRALKGNNKIQGNWGEIILTRVLEASGLRDGHEYETQVSIKTETHSHMQPDVIVRLPQGRDVIIDAKMTLVAYERYFNAEDEFSRKKALQEHITSIRSHINLLGHKDYQQLPGLRTLDYILMFIPIEPAFLLALDKQPELITEAIKSNIMLVSPTTLLVALRTISNLWRYEHQSQNAQQIARLASKLYDKMQLFITDMSSVGQNLERAQDNYHRAMKKLSTGRGNLLSQIETFRSLGVEVKREINPKLAEQAMITQYEEYDLCKK